MITIETILFWCGLVAAFVVIWKYIWKPFWSAEARAIGGVCAVMAG